MQLSDLDPMNVQDLGDGTSIDITSGQLYDNVTGNAINATGSPNVGVAQNTNPTDNVAAPVSNVTQGTAPAVSVTASGADTTVANSSGSATFLSAADQFVHSVESAFTNAYTPLVNAGVIQTPAQKAATQAAADARNAQLAQTQAISTAQVAGSGALVIIAILAAFVLLKRKAA